MFAVLQSRWQLHSVRGAFVQTMIRQYQNQGGGSEKPSIDTKDPTRWSSHVPVCAADIRESGRKSGSQEKKRGKHQRELTAIDFVRVVPAVRASVAPPAAVDALPIRALELVAAAATGQLLLAPVAILWPLVGAVGAVAVAVAAPLGWNTHGVVALEGAAAAGGFGAGGLVRAVGTVVVLVADKGGGDTVAVGTLKLVLLAFPGSCSGRRGENISSTIERRWIFRIVLIGLS